MANIISHGGSHGLDSKLFDYEVVDDLGHVKIIFKTTLQEIDDHYPGDMEIKVTHTYDANHCWTIQYEATSTKTTLFNPMNHVYCNLNRDNNVIDNHRVSSSNLNMYPLNDYHMIGRQYVSYYTPISKGRLLSTDVFAQE